jgi:hypothetical protein
MARGNFAETGIHGRSAKKKVHHRGTEDTEEHRESQLFSV